VSALRDTGSAASRLAAVRELAMRCTACALHERATQTVFGEGAPEAEVMLVGEQPGDHEDRTGRPFVGPAGRLLDEALERAGIDRERVYVTNVVKHFKWVSRGKRRIHQSPSVGEVNACLPWLTRELEIVNPRLVVALGSIAGRALFGPGYRVTRQRGEIVHLPGGHRGTGTVHPSSLLRIEDDDERHRERERFVDELSRAWRTLPVRTP
jgi:DNA polymerase